MELLNKMIQDIALNYDVKFIVEQVSFENESVVYRLKRRKTIRIVFYKNTVDEHELNYHGHKINFKSHDEIITYLKFQFSEREGFLNRISDLDIGGNDAVAEKPLLELVEN